MMLSSTIPENHAAPSFKTPAGPKRRAFGDISNRKPTATTKNKGSIVQKSTSFGNTLAKPLTNHKKPAIVVKKETKHLSFDEEDDDSIEMPAGRLGKDLGTEEWLLGGDDFFAQLERDEKEYEDAILRGQEESKKAEIERHEKYKMELEEECRMDGLADGKCVESCNFHVLTTNILIFSI